ncbi:MAG: hypothetical protein WBB23_08445 [Desulforhopalus sp.]
MDLKVVLEKLSSYKIFNYLFPGILLAGIGSNMTSLQLLFDNLVIGVFVYYFYGIVISRVGSIIIEPLFKKTRFIEFAPYETYISACKIDEKISLLSEENNVYRTLISTFFCLFIVVLYEQIKLTNSFLSEYSLLIVLTGLIVLFAFAYRKQTNYVKARIDGALKETHVKKKTEV